MKTKQNYKKIISIIIIATGIAAAYLIIADVKPQKSESAIGLAAEGGNNNQAFNFKSQRPELFNPRNNENAAAPETENLTDALIRVYASEILKRNPEGPQLVNNQKNIKMPPQTFFENILKEKLERGLEINLFEEKDIKTNPDNSPAAIKKYLENLKSVTQKNFKDFKKTPFMLFNEWLNEKKSDSFYEYLALTSNYIDGLLETPAPSSWQAFHLQLINLQQKKLIVYGSILNLDRDPLKTLIAVNKIEELSQENENLAVVLNEQLKELATLLND